MPSQAHLDFLESFKDAERLFDLFEKEQNIHPPGPEVLKRAALVMGVAAWETFIKDLLREKFPSRLKKAKSPAEFSSAFEKTADQWMRSNAKTPANLIQWTGDEWKKLLKDTFDSQLKNVHTPGPKRVRQLLSDFLGLDITGKWKVSGHAHDQSEKRLDGIMALRGEVAHVARKDTKSKHLISKDELKTALDLLKNLVAATDKLVEKQ